MMNFISQQEAIQIIGSRLFVPKDERVNLDLSPKRVLVENVKADRDMPPFDRVTMDGIAISHKTFEKGRRTFNVERTIAAGDPQQQLNDENCCVEIMTGATMPLGADTVIRYEDTDIKDGVATVTANQVISKQNVHFRGIDKHQGDLVLKEGVQIGAAEVSIAASVGKSELMVKSLPVAVVISTGNELVDIQDNPEPHQIRKSNVFAIRTQLEKWGIECELLHLPDNQKSIESNLANALTKYDLIVLSGGVSKGKFDYVPDALAALGVEKHFHKVKQRPGKPFWFGSTTRGTVVFALPGNPVSTFMCLQVYIRYWLNASLNLDQPNFNVVLGEDVKFKPDLSYFLQCSTKLNDEGRLIATPVIGNGSGDFANLVDADGFVLLPHGRSDFDKGEVYAYFPYKSFQ
jgi:molybdopterin molybdotransferase